MKKTIVTGAAFWTSIAMPDASEDHLRSDAFHATHWTMVLKAGMASSEQAEEALQRLCETYWYPLYAFVRRRGYSPHDAEDLTQAFFARLLEKRDLASVDREKGRFRSFLLASMKHFLANEWKKGQTQKRGGGQTVLSLDYQSAEQNYAIEPADDWTPEKLFQRRWALTVLERVLSALRTEMVAANKEAAFDAVKDTISGGRGERPLSEVAAELGMTEGALKVWVHRLRKRYRELLMAEVSHTLADAENVEDELRGLFSALSG